MVAWACWGTSSRISLTGLTCSDRDVPADNDACTVAKDAAVRRPMDISLERLRLEGREEERAILQELPEAGDGSQRLGVHPGADAHPLGPRRGVAASHAVHAAARHVREFHAPWRLRRERRALLFVGAAGHQMPCNQTHGISTTAWNQEQFDP